MHKFSYGYYLFLNFGDYHKPEQLNDSWIYNWSITEWDNYLKKLVNLGSNTLLLYLNGHYLPYDSESFPDCIDKTYVANKGDIPKYIIEKAKQYDIKVIGVITTTGHAGRFSELNPHTCITKHTKRADATKNLIAFPEKMRERKTSKQQGHAQLGYGVLCHHHLQAQNYAVTIIKEILNNYPMLDGLALHPPETVSACYCNLCNKLFYEEYKKDLQTIDEQKARAFFIKSYLKIQQTIFIPTIKKINPRLNILTFTIPWFFEENFAEISALIAENVILIDWDYNLDSARIMQLKNRLISYQKYNHTVWFMPTSGTLFISEHTIAEQIQKVKQQMDLALQAGVTGIIQFIGPRWNNYIEKTKLVLPKCKEYYNG